MTMFGPDGEVGLRQAGGFGRGHPNQALAGSDRPPQDHVFGRSPAGCQRRKRAAQIRTLGPWDRGDHLRPDTSSPGRSLAVAAAHKRPVRLQAASGRFTPA